MLLTACYYMLLTACYYMLLTKPAANQPSMLCSQVEGLGVVLEKEELSAGGYAALMIG
jgi:hypothetical protein